MGLDIRAMRPCGLSMSKRIMSKKIKKSSSRRTPVGQALTELVLSIFKANVELVRAGPLVTRDPDITAIRWQLLAAIEFTSLTAAELGRQISLTRQGALLNVQVLHELGYVALVDNPEDQRAKKVALTDTGRAKLEEIDVYQVAWVNRIAAQFDKSDIEAAIKVIDKLQELTSVSTASL